MIHGRQAPDRIGLDESAISPRGSITIQATALRVTGWVGFVRRFSSASVILERLPLYELLDVMPAVNRQPGYDRVES